MRKLIVCLIVLAFVVVGSAGAQNLLTDGGFEVGLLTGPDEWIAYGAGETIGAWDVTADTVDLFGACGGGAFGVPALEGCELANLGDSYAVGAIEQSFATIIGAEYQVSFWSSEYPESGIGTGTVRVYWDNSPPPSQKGDDLLDTWTVDQTWTQFVFTFTATETTSILEFTNGTGGGDALNLDDVSVILMGPIVGTVDPTSLAV